MNQLAFIIAPIAGVLIAILIFRMEKWVNQPDKKDRQPDKRNRS